MFKCWKDSSRDVCLVGLISSIALFSLSKEHKANLIKSNFDKVAM